MADPATPPEIERLMASLGANARAAAKRLARASSAAKDRALRAAAEALRAHSGEIAAANARDLAQAERAGRAAAYLDRLALDADRIEAMARGLEAIAELPDPVGQELASWERPNGLKIARVRVPLGVIGVVYESRPNVTADAGALCLKAGNAVILRGGADSLASARAIHACLEEGLAAADLPRQAIQLVHVPDRAAVGEMLKGLGGAIDVLVPRGGKSLVARVQEEARVPVFGHLEGICHVYVHERADADTAARVLLDSKLRRTGVCGAAETLLIDRACLDSHLAAVLEPLLARGCVIRGDAEICARIPDAEAATEDDWSAEYLDAILSVKTVDDLDAAMAHISRYGTQHTETILTEDPETADRFLSEVDSAIVLWNASTQFADGGEFGMGAEIGIATGRLHARGPVGVEQLTTFNYRVRGQGHIRG